MLKFMRPLALILCLFCSAMALAEEGAAEALLGPHQLMKQTTDEVMNVLAEAESYYATEPERYFEEVHRVLDQVVDFQGFTRGVMGEYAASKRYRSLNEEGKMQLREQVDRFSDMIRVGLVRTYGKGLLAFSGSRIEILPPETTDQSSTATVVQLIHNTGDQPYTIHYKLRKDRNGEWKLRNMIVESVNLGQIYRSQFEAAMRDHQGNIDKVIDSWLVDTDGAKSS